MSINRVMVSGNLTRDPELRQTASGMAVLSFGIAVNERRKNSQSGEWEDYANFIDVTMFGNRAQGVQPYLYKGMKVAIEGRLRYSSWEDKNGGGRRSKLEVIADEIDFLAKQPNQSDSNGAYASQQNTYQQNQANAAYNVPQPSQMSPQQAQQYVNQQHVQMQQGAAQMQQVQSQYAQMQQGMAVNPSVYDEDIPF